MVIIKETKVKEAISVSYPSSIELVTVKMRYKPRNFIHLLQNTNFTIEHCVVQATFYFNKVDDWNSFKNDLSKTIRGISQFGGTNDNHLGNVVKCVGPKSAGDPPIFINPDGYEYARYAGIV
jgi:hypothetical protein